MSTARNRLQEFFARPELQERLRAAATAPDALSSENEALLQRLEAGEYAVEEPTRALALAAGAGEVEGEEDAEP